MPSDILNSVTGHRHTNYFKIGQKYIPNVIITICLDTKFSNQSFFEKYWLSILQTFFDNISFKYI